MVWGELGFIDKRMLNPYAISEETAYKLHHDIFPFWMNRNFRMVTSQTLKDAMANPENYKHLMVRISGYNAYFVTLNRDIQIELVERAEYGISSE